MKQDRILIVDDDPTILEMINASLGNDRFDVITTESASEAIEIYQDEPTLVVITDLNMPEMTGQEVIKKIQSFNLKPIIIVLTAEMEINTVVELMKTGVYDYIVKPFNPKELLNRVEKAFEFAELKILQDTIQKEREIRIEHQLNWNAFKENMIRKDQDKTESGLMTNLNTSLIQGAGFGTIAPLIELIQASAKLEGENYVVQKDFLDMLFENAQFSNKLITIIGDIDYIINSELEKEKISLFDFHLFISSMLPSFQKDLSLKNNVIVLGKNPLMKKDKFLGIHREYFQKAISELIYNAMKFSANGSKIYILFEIVKENFEISVLNTPNPDSKEKDGITPEYQNIIFEPFFRISKIVYDMYPTLDFGLGLTFVEKIIRNHKGKMRVFNLKNFLENSKSQLVSFTIELPILLG